MMTAYILSILGIVVAGIVIDIIVPTGSINKYIKSIYGIFVVAVILSPIIKFLNANHDFNFTYKEYEVSENLLNYIYDKKVKECKQNIENTLNENGLQDVDIVLDFSTKDNELIYNSCMVNLQKLVIVEDKLNINKYEFIKEVVKTYTNLSSEVIMFYE